MTGFYVLDANCKNVISIFTCLKANFIVNDKILNHIKHYLSFLHLKYIINQINYIDK